MTALEERPARAAARADDSTDYGRLPPHDESAEQSVLGAMMLSKDAIADVLEALRPGDFYKPRHQIVFDAILDLYGRGEPADAVTVAAELDRHGTLQRVGGAPYLHTLLSVVPTAANASYYARLVAEKAVLRRLVEAGTRVVQYGYAGAEGAEVADVVDRAQAEIYDVTNHERRDDYVALADLLQPTMDELDELSNNGGLATGVPTGFIDLDELTNGLHGGQMITIAARPGIGKALALNTILPTPSGWTTMGEVKVGEELLGADGQPTRIVAATEVLCGRPCYDVEFSDGTVITADEQHQWPTRGGIVITADLQPGETIPTTAPVELPEIVEPDDDPHTAGRWLGGDLGVELRGYDTVVTRYLRGSLRQRREMLRGLLLASTVKGGPGHSFTIIAGWRLPEDRSLAVDLLCSLGFVVAPGWAGAPIHVVAGDRSVIAVRKRHSVAVRCVQVDNADHLYLAGDGMVPTHNSTLALDFMRSCSIKHQMTSILFSLEMSKSEIVMRLLSAEAGIKLGAMRSGKMSDDDWARLAKKMSEISEAPLYIDDSANLTMMEIRAKARRLAQKTDLRLIVVDYMQLMTSGKRVESRQQEVSEFSRTLKLMAKELDVPVVALSQLNRGPEQRTDKRPLISDLRESGSIEQDSDLVILLHRPDANDPDHPQAGEVEIILGKHRSGPTRTIKAANQLHMSRFANMAPGQRGGGQSY
ncbi:replicative DNA helicase [Rhodococcus erythropolis]|uniref:replicative DNA helicase n=1 Tax=Rhodococcus erythropolis TaxID=1833 RepID=UPI001C9AEE77|nr:replicative DNA helicase [Rhodococcus erythropolis]MBY6388897.1 replicative DNA helicase [Rhodococcus erythropolis]